MSRGLGKLQREILATLDEAKAMRKSHLGCSIEYDRHGEVVGHWTSDGDHLVRLRDHVYDLRASAVLLGTHNLSRQAAFSRAVRGLVDRGFLIALLSLVPIVENRPKSADDRIHRLADGVYLMSRSRRIRYVEIAENTGIGKLS